MKAIKFKGSNVTFAENQPEYQPIPGYKFETPTGEFVTCWQFSFWEIVRIIWYKRMWISMMTFNKPLTPIFPTTKQSEVIIIEKPNLKQSGVPPEFRS